MLTANIAKSILSRVVLSQPNRAIYSTAGFDKHSFKDKRKQRQLKAYQKLFFTSPLMNINIEMIMAINQLRPKATYIIAAKNGQFPKQISNSTYNIIECLNYIQGFKYYYKSFPALIENLTKVLTDKIDFSITGLHKANAIKKLIQMVNNIDSVYGEIFNQLVSVYLIWGLESSINIKRKLIESLAPLKQRSTEINQKKKHLLQQYNNDQSKMSEQDKLSLTNLNRETSFIKDQIQKLVYQNRFLREQDFLCGLHYCLQRGYYSETVIRQFTENILQRDNYTLPEFEFYLRDEQEFLYEKPLSDIYNKKAMTYTRMYSGAVYRIKILNELKRMKKHDAKFMDFLKEQKNVQQNKQSESSSQQSPFINGQNSGIDLTSQSTSEQKPQQMSDKLIQESLISKKSYTNLVNKYIELLERKDVLCFILSEEAISESLRVTQTEFFSYLHESDNTLTIAHIKSRYLNVFKEIFNIEKNGSLFVESPYVEGAFETILKMYDYGDRKEIFGLLKLYERHLLTKNVSQLKSVAPFYVFQKYHYKSNFVASKLFEFINFKYRFGREDFTIKEELILVGNEICRYLSLYFKLLQSDFTSLLAQNDFNNSNGQRISKVFGQSFEKSSQNGQQHEVKQTIAKYQQQFQQAIEIFLTNYNKMISVIYLQRENSGFIGKGIQLTFDYLKVKYLSTKAYEQNLYIEGKVPQQDIKKIINESAQSIKPHREYIKNIYEKHFQTKITTKSQNGPDVTTTTLNYNPYAHTMWLKKNAVFSPLDQVSVILDIVETAIQLQTMKNMEFYEDVLVVFKSIFENKKLIKLMSQHQTYPQILKKLIRISQLFKGSYKNESNKLFESILNLTSFNLNNFLHNARINIARQIINADKSVPIDERFQPYMQHLQLSNKIEKNIRIWEEPTYQINKQTVISHIRSDIIHNALTENSQLQKIIREQLAKIKTIKPNERIKNIKFQLNYLEYPYLANVAINKNNELIVVLVRRSGHESDKQHNAALNSYYDECENYFRKKGNKVIVASNQTEIRNTLRDLIK